MENSIAEVYYKKLIEGNDPNKTLVTMYRVIFDRQHPSDYARMGKLINLYGWELVYRSILDSFISYDEKRSENPMNLISYVVKRNFEYNIATQMELTPPIKVTENMRELLESRAKLKAKELLFE